MINHSYQRDVLFTEVATPTIVAHLITEGLHAVQLISRQDYLISSKIIRFYLISLYPKYKTRSKESIMSSTGSKPSQANVLENNKQPTELDNNYNHKYKYKN